MKVRAILKSLLFAYALQELHYCWLAFVLFAFNLERDGCRCGDYYDLCTLHALWEALWPAKLCGKTDICGVLHRFGYYVLLLTVSFGKRQLGYECSSCSYNFFMCTGGGTLGGMLS